VSPVSVISHLLAIALGVWGGFWLMGGIAPDLPDDEIEPGVEAPDAVKGGDSDSLLRAGPLAAALAQLDEQMAAGATIASLRLSPEGLQANSSGGGVELETSEIPPDAPERIVTAIARQRPEVSLDDVQYMELRAGAQGPEWYVQLDLDIDPPRTYVAPLDGSSATAGG
jgi:hypothetical protein